MFWFFGHEACGILAPQPGIEPTPPALEGEVLTSGLPGKPLERSLTGMPGDMSHVHTLFHSPLLLLQYCFPSWAE